LADLEAHIRELAKRVEREPGSRFFVPLADEYRKAGRLADAIATLEGGLVVHGGYVAARVALARAYLEAGRIEESISAFSKALADDPSNLVAAKALGDLHLSRGEPLEALKRYLRYRAISGDRRLDDVISRLEAETTPPPPAPEPVSPPSSPFPLPPPVAAATPPPALLEPPASIEAPPPPRRDTDPFDISDIPYRPPVVSPGPVSEGPEVFSRDLSLDKIAASKKRDSDGEIITKKIRLPEATWPFEPPAPPPPVERAGAVPQRELPKTDVSSEPESPRAEPAGRTLADLYLDQGHYSEALAIYRELLAADPGNEDLARRQAEAEHLVAATAPQLPPGDPARQRRLEKIRVVNEWLAAIRTSAAAGRDGRLR
jgi:tetratricopeptide (TPR) repeat protein